jgi:hypothetical protein
MATSNCIGKKIDEIGAMEEAAAPPRSPIHTYTFNMSITDARIVFQLLTAERTVESLLADVADDSQWCKLLTAEEDEQYVRQATTDLTALSSYTKIRIGRAMIRKHGLYTPVTEELRTRLVASIPSRQDQCYLWLACQGLAAYDYDSQGWHDILWRHEYYARERERQRVLAAERAPRVATFTDDEVFNHIYEGKAYCYECECIELSLIPRRRAQYIQRLAHDLIAEEEAEERRREAVREGV